MTCRVALETATDQLSVAVQPADGNVVSARVDGARRHASDLIPVLDRLLRQAGAGPSDLELVVLADGPGSFTGLRVGAAVAKVLAASGARLATASTLLVRAVPHAGAGRILALGPALRGEVFAGIWELGSTVRCHFAPRALAAADLAELPEADALVGEGPPALMELLQRRGARLLGSANPEAADLLRLVDWPGGITEVRLPGGWEPHYGRPAEAQARWERTHGRPLPDPDRTA